MSRSVNIGIKIGTDLTPFMEQISKLKKALADLAQSRGTFSDLTGATKEWGRAVGDLNTRLAETAAKLEKIKGLNPFQGLGDGKNFQVNFATGSKPSGPVAASGYSNNFTTAPGSPVNQFVQMNPSARVMLKNARGHISLVQPYVNTTADFRLNNDLKSAKSIFEQLQAARFTSKDFSSKQRKIDKFSDFNSYVDYLGSNKGNQQHQDIYQGTVAYRAATTGLTGKPLESFNKANPELFGSYEAALKGRALAVERLRTDQERMRATNIAIAQVGKDIYKTERHHNTYVQKEGQRTARERRVADEADEAFNKAPAKLKMNKEQVADRDRRDTQRASKAEGKLLRGDADVRFKEAQAVRVGQLMEYDRGLKFEATDTKWLTQRIAQARRTGQMTPELQNMGQAKLASLRQEAGTLQAVRDGRQIKGMEFMTPDEADKHLNKLTSSMGGLHNAMGGAKKELGEMLKGFLGFGSAAAAFYTVTGAVKQLGRALAEVDQAFTNVKAGVSTLASPSKRREMEANILNGAIGDTMRTGMKIGETARIHQMVNLGSTGSAASKSALASTIGNMAVTGSMTAEESLGSIASFNNAGIDASGYRKFLEGTHALSGTMQLDEHRKKAYTAAVSANLPGMGTTGSYDDIRAWALQEASASKDMVMGSKMNRIQIALQNPKTLMRLREILSHQGQNATIGGMDIEGLVNSGNPMQTIGKIQSLYEAGHITDNQIRAVGQTMDMWNSPGTIQMLKGGLGEYKEKLRYSDLLVENGLVSSKEGAGIQGESLNASISRFTQASNLLIEEGFTPLTAGFKGLLDVTSGVMSHMGEFGKALMQLIVPIAGAYAARAASGAAFGVLDKVGLAGGNLGGALGWVGSLGAGATLGIGAGVGIAGYAGYKAYQGYREGREKMATEGREIASGSLLTSDNNLRAASDLSNLMQQYKAAAASATTPASVLLSIKEKMTKIVGSELDAQRLITAELNNQKDIVSGIMGDQRERGRQVTSAAANVEIYARAEAGVGWMTGSNGSLDDLLAKAQMGGDKGTIDLITKYKNSMIGGDSEEAQNSDSLNKAMLRNELQKRWKNDHQFRKLQQSASSLALDPDKAEEAIKLAQAKQVRGSVNLADEASEAQKINGLMTPETVRTRMFARLDAVERGAFTDTVMDEMNTYITGNISTDKKQAALQQKLFGSWAGSSRSKAMEFFKQAGTTDIGGRAWTDKSISALQPKDLMTYMNNPKNAAERQAGMYALQGYYMRSAEGRAGEVANGSAPKIDVRRPANILGGLRGFEQEQKLYAGNGDISGLLVSMGREEVQTPYMDLHRQDILDELIQEKIITADDMKTEEGRVKVESAYARSIAAFGDASRRKVMHAGLQSALKLGSRNEKTGFSIRGEDDIAMEAYDSEYFTQGKFVESGSADEDHARRLGVDLTAAKLHRDRLAGDLESVKLNAKSLGIDSATQNLLATEGDKVLARLRHDAANKVTSASKAKWSYEADMQTMPMYQALQTHSFSAAQSGLVSTDRQRAESMMTLNNEEVSILQRKIEILKQGEDTEKERLDLQNRINEKMLMNLAALDQVQRAQTSLQEGRNFSKSVIGELFNSDASTRLKNLGSLATSTINRGMADNMSRMFDSLGDNGNPLAQMGRALYDPTGESGLRQIQQALLSAQQMNTLALQENTAVMKGETAPIPAAAGSGAETMPGGKMMASGPSYGAAMSLPGGPSFLRGGAVTGSDRAPGADAGMMAWAGSGAVAGATLMGGTMMAGGVSGVPLMVGALGGAVLGAGAGGLMQAGYSGNGGDIQTIKTPFGTQRVSVHMSAEDKASAAFMASRGLPYSPKSTKMVQMGMSTPGTNWFGKGGDGFGQNKNGVNGGLWNADNSMNKTAAAGGAASIAMSAYGGYMSQKGNGQGAQNYQALAGGLGSAAMMAGGPTNPVGIALTVAAVAASLMAGAAAAKNKSEEADKEFKRRETEMVRMMAIAEEQRKSLGIAAERILATRADVGNAFQGIAASAFLSGRYAQSAPTVKVENLIVQANNPAELTAALAKGVAREIRVGN